jgi:hypothetical protein
LRSGAVSSHDEREHPAVSKFAPRRAPDRKQVEELARSGATLREMGLALDRSIATVRYWPRRWAIARPDARRSGVDPATAPREITRECPRHGPTLFRLDARGTYRCVQCSQQYVAERRGLIAGGSTAGTPNSSAASA